jgi:hypothetical protein
MRIIWPSRGRLPCFGAHYRGLAGAVTNRYLVLGGQRPWFAKASNTASIFVRSSLTCLLTAMLRIWQTKGLGRLGSQSRWHPSRAMLSGQRFVLLQARASAVSFRPKF